MIISKLKKNNYVTYTSVKLKMFKTTNKKQLIKLGVLYMMIFIT